MNTLVIVLIAAVLLTAAYVFYGRWLSKNGELTQKQRHQLISLKMDRIMFQLTVGQYLAISFHLLLEQAL